MTTELAKICEGCPARDNPEAQRLIGELSSRGIACSGVLRDGNPFASVRFNQPTRIRVSCGVEVAIEQDLLSRGMEPSDELINQVACGDFSVLDQPT
jgi:hypothetical protein